MAQSTVLLTITSVSGDVVYSEHVDWTVKVLDIIADVARRTNSDEALLQLVHGGQPVSAGCLDALGDHSKENPIELQVISLPKPHRYDDVGFCDKCGQRRYLMFGYGPCTFPPYAQIDWTPVAASCKPCGGHYIDPYHGDTEEMSDA